MEIRQRINQRKVSYNAQSKIHLLKLNIIRITIDIILRKYLKILIEEIGGVHFKDDKTDKNPRTSLKLKSVTAHLSSSFSTNNLHVKEEKIVYNLTINTQETTKFSRVYEFKTFVDNQQDDNASLTKENSSTSTKSFIETISHIEVKILKTSESKSR